VDEKRSGRPSVLRKVKKTLISKSLQKGSGTPEKLASKLTIKGPLCSKDTVHRYLRFNLGAHSCQKSYFMQNLKKSDGK
jgi:hypothetical protein